MQNIGSAAPAAETAGFAEEWLDKAVTIAGF